MTESRNQAPASARKKMGCGTWALIGIGGFFALSVLGGIQQKEDKVARDAAAAGKPPAASDIDTPIELAVTPEDLRAAYEANEVAAKQRFEGKRLRMTGRLDRIDLDLSDDPSLIFTTAKPYDWVSAGFTKDDSPAIGALTKGQKVTVLCDKVTEVIGTPILRDCSLVR